MQKDTQQNKTILVTGATGQQGGAVVRSLSTRGWKIRALVRDPAKPAAQQLAKNNIELIKGDLFTPASLDEALKGVYGVFSVQTPADGVGGEIIQGKFLADAAQKAQVQHFVYSSVGGAERESGIPHFESKWQVEKHIRAIGLPQRSSVQSSSWTTLRATLARLSSNKIS